MRIENPEQYPKFSRRRFLILVGTGTYAALMAYDKIIYPRFLFSAPEAQDIEPEIVDAAVISISRGVNIRTSPRLPSRTRFRKPDNRLEWEEIEAINGVSLNGGSVFLIINPPIVDGQRTYHYDGLAEDWIKFNIKKRDKKLAKPYYVNSSPNTREFVKIVEYLGPAIRAGSVYRRDEDTLITEDQVGRVIVPADPERMARDIMPWLWSERMRRKFDGILSGKDRILTNVQVVAGGSEQDVEEMLKLETPVNVRNYPGLEYGNGEPVEIIGQAPQGTMIRKILITDRDYLDRFAAVRSEDIDGSLLDSEGKSFDPPAGKIYAINRLYLSTPK